MYVIKIKDPIREGKILTFHSEDFPQFPGRLVTFIDMHGEDHAWAMDLFINVTKEKEGEKDDRE